MCMLLRRVWCTFVFLLSSQHQTSLPVLRTAPLTSIFRKQSPFSTTETSSGGTAFAVPAPPVVRTGAHDLRSTNQVHMLQTKAGDIRQQKLGECLFGQWAAAVAVTGGAGPIWSCQ